MRGGIFAAERDKLRASAELAQTRWQAAEKRAQLEIERERTANVRLQHDVEAATQRAARTEQSARAEIQTLQTQLGDLRHQVGMLEGRLDALRSTHEVQRREREAAPEKDAAAPAARPLRAARKTRQKA